MNHKYNAEIRKMIADGTKNNTSSTAAYKTAVYKTAKAVEEGVKIDGTCVECGKGRYRFLLHPSVVEKYAGTLRETMTEAPCKCGSYLWLISIPPKNSKLDDMM